jgi:Na+/melibiose symporter-like transporter
MKKMTKINGCNDFETKERRLQLKTLIKQKSKHNLPRTKKDVVTIFNHSQFFFSLLESYIFIGLAYQGKNIVYRFIIEYSSLRDFGPSVIGLFFI